MPAACHPALALSTALTPPCSPTRVIGYTRAVGNGSVAYFALGHCHNPAIRAGCTADLADTTPPTFHGSWESPAFIALLGNAIAWGAGT